MEASAGCLQIYNTSDIDRYMNRVRDASARIPEVDGGAERRPVRPAAPDEIRNRRLSSEFSDIP